jgi:hypothetical protein
LRITDSIYISDFSNVNNIDYLKVVEPTQIGNVGKVLGTNLFIDGHPSSRTTPFSEYD